MKHPLVELTKKLDKMIPAQEWMNDPIASKQGVKSLSQAIKTRAARAGIHKINNILNVKLPIPVSKIKQAAEEVISEKFDLDQDTVQRMIEAFMTEIHKAETTAIPQRIIKTSTGMYHGVGEPEHAFNDNPGSFKVSKEPIVTLLDYARALYLVANRFHTQISS